MTELIALSVGPLSLNRERRLVSVRGRQCKLTVYQIDLLWVLASQVERVLSRAQLHAQVRALRNEIVCDYDPAVDRRIDVHVSQIRKALTTASTDGADLIKTVRGEGYGLTLAHMFHDCDSDCRTDNA
jgi:DNA-binding response OmpR family regulator